MKEICKRIEVVWYFFSNYGNKNEFSLETRRDRKVTNLITILTVIAHFIVLNIHAIAGLSEQVWVFAVFMLSFLLLFPVSAYISVNYSKYYLIISTASGPFFMVIFVGLPRGLFLAFSYAQIYILLLVLTLFDFKRQKLQFLTFIALSFFYTLHFDQLFIMFAENVPDITFLQEEYLFFKLPLLTVWFLLLLTITGYKNIIYRNGQIIQELNSQLTHQKEKIQKINMTLRLDVEKRYVELQKQKEKIKECLYLNSHEVRGPLARILGLNYLLKNKKISERDMKSVLDMLDSSSTELNDIISEMSKVLSKDIKNEPIKNQL